MNTLKRFTLGLLVLALSSSIYFLFVSDKKMKQSLLRPTLEAMGSQLFAAVQDDEEKKVLKEEFDKFIVKAENEEIPPEEIEKVAAKILNFGTRDTVISSRAAKNIFALSSDYAIMQPFMMPEATTFVDDGELPGARDSQPPPIKSPPSERMRKRDMGKKELAERLKNLHQFQIILKQYAQSDTSLQPLRGRIFFQADSGLQVVIDANVKQIPEMHKRLEIQRHIRELEREKLLRWQKHNNFVANSQIKVWDSKQDSAYQEKVKLIEEKMKKLEALDSLDIHIQLK